MSTKKAQPRLASWENVFSGGFHRTEILRVRVQEAAIEARQTLCQVFIFPNLSRARLLSFSLSLSLSLSLSVCVVRLTDLDSRGHLVYPDLVVFARDPNHNDVRDKILRQ